MNDLTALLKNVTTLGLTGIVIVPQGREYVAACIDRHENVCDPRNFDPQPTPESAVKDLGRKLENLVQLKAKRQTAAVA